MRLLKQVSHEFVRIVDGLTIILFSEESRHIREQIESTLWLQYLHARNLLSKTHNEIATTFKRLAHILYTVLRSCIGSLSSFLGNGSCTTDGLALKTFYSRNKIFIVASEPSYTVTCQSIRFADAVDNNKAIF